MSSILNFKAALTQGGARPNQFRVELNFPGFVSNGAAAARKGEFLCSSASIPGSVIDVAPLYYRGRMVKLAGERSFNNWGISIINDNDFALHKAFTDWSKYVNDPKENTGLTNPNLYTADMSVHHLDRNGNTVKTYKFVDAWPVSVSDINLDFGDNNTIETFQVELAYGWWEDVSSNSAISATIGINTPIGGIGVNL